MPRACAAQGGAGNAFCSDRRGRRICGRLLCRALENYAEGHRCSIRTSSFEGAAPFLAAIQQERFDVVFMDIDLPNMNGMEAARRMRERDKQAILIFTTNLSQYAIQGYEVDAMDYMLKPVTYPLFELKMHRALQLCKQRRSVDVVINTRGGFVRVSSAAILYVEIYNHHILYHTLDGDYASYGTMKQVVSALPKSGFFRTTASYVVNLRHVQKVEGLETCVADRRIPISRLRKKEFMQAMTSFFNGAMDSAADFEEGV